MKPCPDCVKDAGAALVVLRHLHHGKKGCEFLGVDWAEQVQLQIDVFRIAQEKLDAVFDHMRDYGIMEMEWGPGVDMFHQADECSGDGNNAHARAKLMHAHWLFAQVLDRHNIAQPTNQELAGRMVRDIITPLNWR